MRRPTRTRRLSIAAMVSLLAFVAAVGPYIRSFSINDGIDLGYGEEIQLDRGCGLYIHYPQVVVGDPFTRIRGPFRNVSPYFFLEDDFLDSIWGFAIGNQPWGFRIRIPLWPILLLLLIVPVRWLIARRAKAPAFPVLTDAERAA